MSFVKIEFYGGPLDGEYRDVETGSREYKVPIPVVPKLTAFEQASELGAPVSDDERWVHRYSIGTKLDEAGEIQRVMVYDGWRKGW